MSLVTDLTVTGKVAQFGRGVLADVSAKLLDQFVVNLETTVLAEELIAEAVELEAVAESTPDPVLAHAAAETALADLEAAVEVAATIDHPDVAGEDIPVVRRVEAPEVEPVDLLDTAGSPVLKRALPLLGLVVAVLVLLGLRRRRRRA